MDNNCDSHPLVQEQMNILCSLMYGKGRLFRTPCTINSGKGDRFRCWKQGGQWPVNRYNIIYIKYDRRIDMTRVQFTIHFIHCCVDENEPIKVNK